MKTTCFGLYWPSSGLHNTLEESTKLSEGVLMKEMSMHQSPDCSISSANLHTSLLDITFSHSICTIFPLIY